MLVKALKQLEEGFALGAVGMIEYFSRYGLLKDRADEERKPVADAAWWLVDNVGASRVWLDGAHPNDIIAERDKMKAAIDRFKGGDVLVMPWPHAFSLYAEPFALAPREQVVNIDIFFEGFGVPLNDCKCAAPCVSVCKAAHPHRQEIADKAEFLWRTQQGDKSYVLPALEGSIGYLRQSHDTRHQQVTACADAALRLYHSGWPIHAFDGLLRSAIIEHAVKLNRKSEPKAKTYVWGYTYRPATGWIIRRASTNGVPERTVSGLIMTCEGGEPPEAILYALAKARQADAYEITSVFIKEDAQ